MPPARSATLTRADCIAVAALLLIALGVRLYNLDRSELWFDEAFAALLATGEGDLLFGELARDSSPPLYYLMLRGWSLLLGGHTWTLRVFSVICGLVAIGAMLFAGLHVWNTRAALAGAAMLALSPLHIYYSREVRPYSLFIALVVLSFLPLEQLHRKSRRSFAAYCVAVLAAIYTHNYGVFLLGVLWLWVLLHRVPAVTALWASAVVTACYLPWLPVMLQQMASGSTQWVERLWLDTPPALAPLLSLAGFCIGGRTPDYLADGSNLLPAPVHAVAYVLFGFLVVSALVRDRTGESRRLALAITVLLAAPIALSFAVAPMYLVGRHDVIALPVFLLLAGHGLTAVPARQSLAAGLIVAALAAIAVHCYFGRPPADTARRQSALLLAHAGPNDAVLATGFSRNAVEYYVRQRRPMTFASFPTSFGAHRGWVDLRELDDEASIRSDADMLVRTLQEAVGSKGTLWILHSRQLAGANELLMHRVSGSFRQVPCAARAEENGITCWRGAP